MISIEKLRGIKRLITHKNCPDGIASALIIKDALPDVEVTFMAHGTEEHRELRPDVPTLFCDFSPWTDVKKDMQVLMWLEAGAIVLDHHPTQRDVTMKFVEVGLGAYGENDKNECGAWLAYEHVWERLATRCGVVGITDEDDRMKEQAVREFAELAGVRDTWKKDDPRWERACYQAESLMFWGFDELKRSGLANLTALDGLGRHLFEKKLEHARSAIGESHRFATEKGTRVLMFQGMTPTSDAAEILEKNANGLYSVNADIVVGFHYRVDAGKLQLQFSTRSHTGYDVGAFCKAHRGGGHKAAAGFTVEQSAEVGANPYAVFRLLLDEWEKGQ